MHYGHKGAKSHKLQDATTIDRTHERLASAEKGIECVRARWNGSLTEREAAGRASAAGETLELP